MAAVAGGALPAMAATTNDYSALDAIFDDPASVGGTVQLGADLTQVISTDDRLNRLVLADGSSLVLDLNGHDLSTAAIVLGQGSTLTVTDTSAGQPGTLAAHALSRGQASDPGKEDRAGIETTGATLIIEGRAVVDASSPATMSAGIGGGAHGDGGTIIIRGDADVTAEGAQFGAGIGSGDGDSAADPRLQAGDITIGGNARVTAIAEDGAGIGGGVYTDSGDVTITDHAVVTATSEGGAGIGGGYAGGSNGGTIRIDGDAVVDATGGWGAGIGGGYPSTSRGGANGGIIEIAGNANVIAASTTYGAGIGSGPRGDAGSITISGNPVVTATGIGGGAGIGGGIQASGGDVRLLGGTITAINGADITNTSSAVGSGRSGTTFGSLHIADPATLIIPDPAVLRIPADVTVTGEGQLRGGATPGDVVNNGAVQLATEDVDWSTLGLYPNNYLVTRHANGGTSDQEVRVFATTLAAGARQIPAEPTKADHTLTGWNLAQDGTGDPVTLALDTPISANVTHFAQWAQNPPAPVEEPEDPTGPVTPAAPNTPTTPAPGVTTITAPARSGNLATTGSDLALWGAIAGGLVLAGGLTVLVVRRRAQQH
ncbi:InlB B-repeat-containing protein [Cellulomonas denverensis]|uniref:Gram-positive cocci surface proteins LPxTG domain-containing protein n=1 Tax=Cellulomonas denverensis TaxID=264297 RepID=A0A7X6KY02_9CELL|nr:InlB B-repeat-containing protein [Cellulomonas denverensis]NKY24258.1 hypothetical protein [Cellulomonas denverensis]